MARVSALGVVCTLAFVLLSAEGQDYPGHSGGSAGTAGGSAGDTPYGLDPAFLRDPFQGGRADQSYGHYYSGPDPSVFPPLYHVLAGTGNTQPSAPAHYYNPSSRSATYNNPNPASNHYNPNAWYNDPSPANYYNPNPNAIPSTHYSSNPAPADYRNPNPAPAYYNRSPNSAPTGNYYPYSHGNPTVTAAPPQTPVTTTTAPPPETDEFEGEGGAGPMFNQQVFHAPQPARPALPFHSPGTVSTGSEFGAGRLYSLPTRTGGMGLLENLAAATRAKQYQQRRRQPFNSLRSNPLLWMMAFN